MLKNIFNELKNNSFKRIMLELSILVLLFNTSIYVGIPLLLILVFEVIICKENENLLFLFLFLSFNDEILKLDILHGSISRIIIVLILAKQMLQILKNKIKPTATQIGTLILFAIATLISIINKDGLLASLITYLNIAIIVIFSVILKNKNKSELQKIIEKLCYTIIISVICSSIYGLATVNFLKYMQDGEIVYRFNGSYEPNFMCMFTNLAILALITIKNKIKPIAYYILMAFLININILTASMTGLLSLAIILVIYFIYFRKDYKTIIKNAAIIAIITAILFGVFKIIKTVDNNSFFNGVSEKNNEVDDILLEKDIYVDIDTDIEETDALTHRFKRIGKMLKSNKIDEMTSGRTELVRNFVRATFKKPVLNILVGNGIVNKKVYSKFFGRYCYAHNSYVDVLYNFGIIGFLIILRYLLYTTIKNRFLNVDIKDIAYCKNIKLIRILLLIYASSLSFYTKRMFLIFFLL